jgi:nicotinamidase-related amidase
MLNKKLLFTVLILAISFLKMFSNDDGRKRALVIIDVQEFYFPGGRMPLDKPEAAAANISLVLEAFREQEMPVIHIRHNFEPGGDIHEMVEPKEGEPIISKDSPNAFVDTNLKEFLDRNKINELIICGMQTHMCVEGTVRAASDYGYECIVLSDACATRSVVYGNNHVGWKEVHYSALATLHDVYAIVVDTGYFLDEMMQNTSKKNVH